MRVLNSVIVHVTSAFAVDAHVRYPCVRSTQQWRAEALDFLVQLDFLNTAGTTFLYSLSFGLLFQSVRLHARHPLST